MKFSLKSNRDLGLSSRVEAPVTLKAYLLCAFTAFGGILFGYDSGYISGVLAMDYFKQEFGHPGSTDTLNASRSGHLYHTWEKSLITSILSAGTFLGALLAGSFSDWIGRRDTVIAGCGVFSLGVVLQVASTEVGLLVAGRLIAGLGVGFISATIIMYMSEIAPKAVRGAIVSGYQFAITVGLLIASGVSQSTHNRNDSGSYRIPIAIQFLWAIILAGGLALLPESPRYYVKKDRHEAAAKALATLRGHLADSEYVQEELAELIANYRHEMQHMNTSWADCFSGGRSPGGNLRRVVLGTAMQCFQQFTGINFIMYYGTTFFQQVGIENSFLYNIITNVVNVVSTPVSFWTIEKFGRRPLLIWGAVGMMVAEFIIAIVGTAAAGSNAAGIVLIVFVCIYIFFFASTWGPAAWVVIGEVYPLPIRAKGVALATASNWFWNFVLGYITPYMVDADRGNLGSKVFFVWGSTLTLCALFAHFMVPETKGLSLEQVDQMLQETTPRTSAKWMPHERFSDEKTAGDSAKATGVTRVGEAAV